MVVGAKKKRRDKIPVAKIQISTVHVIFLLITLFTGSTFREEMYKHKMYYTLIDEYLKKRDTSFQRFESQPDRNVEDILTLAKRDVERREVCLFITYYLKKILIQR